MKRTYPSELAAFILRVALGAMNPAHAVLLKLLTFTLAGTAVFFIGVSLPGWLACVTFVAEAIGGVLFIRGIQSRWVTLALLPALFGAILWVHGANGWVFTVTGGGWEYPAFLVVVSVVQVVLGDGTYAMSRPHPLFRLPTPAV